MTSLQVHIDKVAKNKATIILPLSSICIFCILLLLFTSAIILTLIPMYLMKNNIANSFSIENKYLVLNPQENLPALGQTSTIACNRIANKLIDAASLPSSVLKPLSCRSAVLGSSRRRRSRPMNRASHQIRNGKMFMEVMMNYDNCLICRLLTNLKKLIGLKFTVQFDYYGNRTITFIVESMSNNGNFY
ncbi:unnamed protein product [Rotaria sp. Silwood1]|nr:unnamed protein product [Rotaria sp. Silwood1]CAF1550967.1 unnamed protein product [Rotaria sp. Silwood1]CAF1553258.1 unnamed protein product [Rotaria sp. Silwood1]